MIDLTDSGFIRHELGAGLAFFTGRLPASLMWDESRFAAAWDLHPAERHVIHMPGGPVRTPRWQQAYGSDSYYTGRVNRALPVPEVLVPLREWVRRVIEPRLNTFLLNWYDGPGHYIGPHHDNSDEMVPGTPIVTISFGETRTFRLMRGNGDARRTLDFDATNGTVFVIPFDTNREWKHAVPKSARYHGRRISVTLRAFNKYTPRGPE